MSELDNAINSINASATKASKTASFLDQLGTYDENSNVTNPNNGAVVPSIQKKVKDTTNDLFANAESDINAAVATAAGAATSAITSATQASDARDEAVAAAADASNVEERTLGVGASLYKGTGVSAQGNYVQNGDVVPAGTTHLSIIIDGKVEDVAMSPITSGAVSLLTETSATVGVTPVTLHVFRNGGYQATNIQLQSITPRLGEQWFNTTDNSIHMGDGATPGGVKHLNVNTLSDYTNRVFKGVNNMLSGTPVRSSIGDICSTGGSMWKHISGDGSDITHYKPINDIYASDFGVTGLGLSDDTSALNSALSHLKTLVKQPVSRILGTTPYKLNLGGGVIRCTGSIDATGLTNHGWQIDGGGAVIFSEATGTIAFDLFTSRWGTISQLQVFGDESNRPSIGVGYGRDQSLATANSLVFDNVTTSGYFSLTAVYNYCAEVDTHITPTYINYDSSSTSYALILDGLNVFGVTSDFVTLPAANTKSSNIQHTFIGGSTRKLISGPAVFMTQIKQLEFQNHYIMSNDDNGIVAHFNNQDFFDIKIDAHFEKNGMKSCVRFETGDYSSQILGEIKGFNFTDHAPQAASRCFWAETGLNVRLIGEIDIPFYQQEPSLGLFQPRPQFSVYGILKIGNLDFNNGVELHGEVFDYSVTPTGNLGGNCSVSYPAQTIHKGKHIFTSTVDDIINLANIASLKNVTIYDGAVQLRPLSVSPIELPTGTLAVDDGTNWSGVNPSGVPKLVFRENSGWVLK